MRELRHERQTGIGRFLESVLSEAPALLPAASFYLYADRNARFPAALAERRVLAEPSTLLFDQVSLPRALARDRIDVFFSPYYKAPLAAPCPAVITIHDLLFLKRGGHGLKLALFKPWARLIASRAAAVLTDSRCSRRDLEEILGLDGERVVVVPLGVGREFSPSARELSPALARRLGIPERYVLTVTNFQPHKNDRLLIEAFAGLADRDPAIGLVLAGHPARPAGELRTLAATLGIERRVFLPGTIPEADLPALYAGAAVFAFPSLYEGFGLPVLEAMASGVPVVCSRAASLPEIASGAALLVDPEDGPGWTEGLERLLTDEAERKRRAAAGLARARDFTWRETAARIVAVLERAAGS